MSKMLLIVAISFFSLNSHALLKVKTNTGRIIQNENLQAAVQNGQLLINDLQNFEGLSPLLLNNKAIAQSGFRSAAQMLDLLTKTKNFPNGEYTLNCTTLEASSVVSACFLE